MGSWYGSLHTVFVFMSAHVSLTSQMQRLEQAAEAEAHEPRHLSTPSTSPRIPIPFPFPAPFKSSHELGLMLPHMGAQQLPAGRVQI